MRAGNPVLILDQIASDHGDLCDGASEGEQSKAQEAEEKIEVAQCGRGRFTVNVRHRHCSRPRWQGVENGAELDERASDRASACARQRSLVSSGLAAKSRKTLAGGLRSITS